MFDRIFTFVAYTFFAFVLITSMENLGKIIGFEQMGDLGISTIFGAVYLNLLIEEKDEKKDKK